MSASKRSKLRASERWQAPGRRSAPNRGVTIPYRLHNKALARKRNLTLQSDMTSTRRLIIGLGASAGGLEVFKASLSTCHPTAAWRLLRVLGARFGTFVGRRSSAVLRYRTDFDGRSCHLAGRALRALQYWQEIARLLPVTGEGHGRRDARSRSSISSCVGALKQISSRHLWAWPCRFARGEARNVCPLGKSLRLAEARAPVSNVWTA